MNNIYLPNVESITLSNVNIELTESKTEYTSATTDIISKVAYLLGVPKKLFESDMHSPKNSVYQQLNENLHARIIRTLCKIRYTIIKNFDLVKTQMMYDLKNINTMADIFDVQDIKHLEKNGIYIVKANYKPETYIIDLNALIEKHINNVQSLFPLWVEWQYIKNLFIMPKGASPKAVKDNSLDYARNQKNYPYQVYISWSPVDKGNILHNDKKFLDVLYEHHHSIFYDKQKVTEASTSIKKTIYDFLSESKKSVIVVDCENSDPYKLYSTLKSLNVTELQKIKKIVLYNDIHTTTAWKILSDFVSIPVEEVLIERLKAEKSLVDVKMTAGTCKEYYQNNIESFILCSSDSDFWGLISSLPEAKFLVMVEKKKCGESIQVALENAGIFYCYMESFGNGNIEEIKIKALNNEIECYINENLKINVENMLRKAYEKTRISMSDKEKNQYYNKHIKPMRLTISSSGDLSIILN